MKFGKHPKRSDYRTLRFGDYNASLPTPLPAMDQVARVLAKTPGVTAQTLFPMDGNDSLGDCTCAAIAHAGTLFSGLVGTPQVPAAADVISFYNHLTMGEDTGLDELTVLNAWVQQAPFGDHLSAFVALDIHNRAHVMQAIEFFGGVYLGFQVPDNCMDQFNAGQVWTPGTLTQDGHAVFAVAYDADGVTVLTWGTTQKATWAWWDACVDEAYALLALDAETTGFTPGLDYTALEADLKSLKAD